MDIYDYKKTNATNLADLVALVNQVASQQYTLDYFQKKYQTPWSGGQYHAWIAYEKSTGQAVAVAAALPFMMTLPDGTHAPVTQMIETFTLPEHRGRGLMTTLAKKLLAEHRDSGTELFFGLTNQNNVYGFVHKLGFTHTGTMSYCRIKIRTFPLEALCRRAGIPALFRWWAGIVIRPYLAPAGTVLPNAAQAEGYASVWHDELFFGYKSFTFNRICRLSGIDAWLKFESGLLVGDVVLPETCSDGQFDQWMQELKRIARRAGLRQIIFQTYDGSQLAVQLSKRYPLYPSWSMCCLAPGDLAAKMRFCYGDFDTF